MRKGMEDIIGSIFFYLTICFILLFCAMNIEIKHKERFYLYVLIIILTLVAGLRHKSVGIDTEGYIRLISELRKGYLPKLNNISEQGFILLSYIIMKISRGYTVALIVYAFITNVLIVLRLHDYKDKISFTWAIFIYYMLFYFTTFNTIRQWLAMAIVFFATRYISSDVRAIIKFSTMVLIAALMHATAVFAVFYVPIYYFSLPSKNRKEQIRKFSMIMLAFLVTIYVYGVIEKKYNTYFSSTIYGDISWMNIALALAACVIVLYDKKWKIVIRKHLSKSTKNPYLWGRGIRFESLSFFVGIVLTLMVFLTRYADRVGQYYMLFEIVFFSYYIKNTRTRGIAIVAVLVLCIYLRLTSFLSSGYGEIPYIPFWA